MALRRPEPSVHPNPNAGSRPSRAANVADIGFASTSSVRDRSASRSAAATTTSESPAPPDTADHTLNTPRRRTPPPAGRIASGAATTAAALTGPTLASSAASSAVGTDTGNSRLTPRSSRYRRPNPTSASNRPITTVPDATSAPTSPGRKILVVSSMTTASKRRFPARESWRASSTGSAVIAVMWLRT